MNAISLNRLKYLFREYFATHWKRDLMIVGGIFFVTAFFTRWHFPWPESDGIIIIMSIVLVGTFSFLQKGSRGMNYLMMPANTVEKVIFNILLIHIYYTIILLIPSVLGYITGEILSPRPNDFTILTKVGILYYPFYVILFVIQSFYLFASIYFRKNALLKTILVFAALFFLGFMIMYLLSRFTKLTDFVVVVSEEISKDLISCSVFNGVYVADLFSYTLYKYARLYNGVLLHITPIFFWVLSYFRLKETEV